MTYGHRLGARRRRVCQLGQVHQHRILQSEQPVVSQHSDRERSHRLGHRERVPADVVDPTALADTAVVGDDVKPFDAQPTSIGDLAEPVERRLQSHRLMLDHLSN